MSEHAAAESGGRAPSVQVTTSTGIEAMLMLSPDAVVVVAADGTIARANELAATLFRTTVDDLQGSSVDVLVPEELRQGHVAQRASFHESPSVRSMGSGRELRAQRDDGTQFPVDISLQPVYLDNERLVLAVVRDVSSHHALREANRELAADARTLREFVSLASHELRTPLTSVKGFAETLLSGRASDEQQQERLLQRIVHNADRQEALVTGLLDLSRIQRGRLEITSREVDLTAVVVSIHEALEDEDIHLEVPPLVVHADPLRLEQVLLNLVVNALRYGDPPVTVRAVEADTEVVITVRDEGPGVAAEFESAMFEAFHQQSTGDRRDAEGLGLGLFLSRELMHAMGGTIAYRREDDRATCFDVSLPLAEVARRNGGVRVTRSA